ncbi:MAG: MerR family transcriptional regulator [Ferruginibacter sp.]
MNTVTATDQQARPYTNKELAALYGVSTKTLRTWLLRHQQSIGPKSGRYFTSKQVRIIFDGLGEPGIPA